MNTPTPTPRTDTATYPADCLGKTLVTNRDCARELERELTTLTAELTIALTKWNGALERALKAEAELAKIVSAKPYIESFSDDALDIEYFRHLKEVEDECLEQAIINGKGAQREADLLGKIERLERELAKVQDTKELNRINDSYEHEMQTFSKRPSNRIMTDVIL